MQHLVIGLALLKFQSETRLWCLKYPSMTIIYIMLLSIAQGTNVEKEDFELRSLIPPYYQDSRGDNKNNVYHYTFFS